MSREALKERRVVKAHADLEAFGSQEALRAAFALALYPKDLRQAARFAQLPPERVRELKKEIARSHELRAISQDPDGEAWRLMGAVRGMALTLAAERLQLLAPRDLTILIGVLTDKLDRRGGTERPPTAITVQFGAPRGPDDPIDDGPRALARHEVEAGDHDATPPSHP